MILILPCQILGGRPSKNCTQVITPGSRHVVWKNDMLPGSADIRDQSLKWSKICRNFACLWPPNFFGDWPPEFLVSDYKLQLDSDHLAKFQGDRLRDLGESVAKQKKTSAVKHKPVRNYRSGRPNEGCNSCATLAGLVLT